MGKHSDTDKAIRNIMNWAERPEWLDEHATVFDAHLALACDRVGISREDLGRELDNQGYGGMLFGIMFEDFVSRRLPPDDRNIIDDYLTRRGWRESVHGRRYLQQLRDSMLSLYEVIEVSRGHHCDVRDLVRGGEPVRVHEHMGTQNLVRWDRIAARVLKSEGQYIFSGGILPFPQEAAQSLLRVLAESRKQFNKELARAAGKEAAAKMSASEDLDELFLRDAAPAFTSLWLVHVLERLRAPLPEMVNRDGEALVFTETRFPVDEKNRNAIIERLETAAGWERDPADEPVWTWLPEDQETGKLPEQGLSMQSFYDGRHPIAGTLELQPKALTFTANSLERTERGKDFLMTLLRDLVGPPLTKVQTPEQLMAEHETPRQTAGGKSAADTIDPEIASEIMRDYLDQHYHRCLDEPIPMLDNKTPRQCARSKRGREKVIDWLKHLENNELHRAARQGQEPYDSSWMWEELKLAKFRR